MNKTNIIIVLLLLLSSCSHIGPRSPSSDDLPPTSIEQVLASEYQDELQELQILIEEALVWRSKSLTFYEQNKEKFGKKNFSHQDLLDIFSSVKDYKILRDKLFNYSKRYSEIFSSAELIKLTTSSKTENGATSIKINPTEYAGKELLLQMKISFAASLVLYDNYLIGIYPYVNHRKTRKLINRDIPELHNSLEKITDSFFDVNQRFIMMRAQKLFKEDLAFEEKNNVTVDSGERYLELLALQSPFYGFLEKKQIDLENQNAVKAYLDRIWDKFNFLNESFTFVASKTFGNSLGLVAFREGYLTKLSTEEKNKIKSSLRPLDIFLEKTPFRLTDQFIPGYYGHVAIWIGTEAELKEIGVWDNPLVQKYHKQIQSGHHIIEALRPGVEINTLDHFLNIDDLLVLRHQNLTDAERKEYLLRAFAQIGKEYDFNFDVETDSKIVCSEIVYVVFHNIDWPTQKQLGRFTISPDHVARKALDGTVEPVLMYRSGKLISEEAMLDNLKSELKH